MTDAQAALLESTMHMTIAQLAVVTETKEWKDAHQAYLADMKAQDARMYGERKMERCTELCAEADYETIDDCECPCGGENHGGGMDGWRVAPWSSYLIVRWVD